MQCALLSEPLGTQDEAIREKEAKAIELERQERDRELNKKAAEAEKLRVREKFHR